jgi:hypothetical protein
MQVPQDVKINPDPGKLPGGPQIQQLLDGLGGWALFAALAGLLISVIVWAMGSFGGNYHAVSKGKTGVLVCAAAAIIAGGAAPIINFFSNLGSQIR